VKTHQIGDILDSEFSWPGSKSIEPAKVSSYISSVIAPFSVRIWVMTGSTSKKTGMR
jgi:hypothetical protein